MANLNVNYTSSAGLVPVDVQQYMDRNFMQRVTNNHIWARDTQKKILPIHESKRIVFTKMNPFDISVDPLKEGVTPDGQTVTTSTFTATVKPYGKYVSVTDEIDWVLIDNVKREISLRLGDQAADTLDTIARNAICGGTNVQYAGSGHSKRSDLAATDIMTYAETKKAVRTLKKNKAKPFGDGYYHAIVDAETVFDLMSDSMFTDIAKYQDKSNLERGEIGYMYGVKFFETTNPMVYETESYLYDTISSVALAGWNGTTKVASVAKSTIDATSGTQPQSVAHFIRRMAGKMVTLYDTSASAVAVTGLIDHCESNGSNVDIYFRWTSGTLTYASGDTITPTPATAVGVKPHATVIYGQDFGGEVELAGGGKNAEMIIKPIGSSGTDDPLNQRGTIGWKVRGYTVTILQDAFIVRIEHGVSG